MKLLGFGVLLIWTSCVSHLSTYRILFLSICIWFLRLQAQVPSRQFDLRTLALSNYEELLGLFFCSSSAGIIVLCGVFCLSHVLSNSSLVLNCSFQLWVGLLLLRSLWKERKWSFFVTTFAFSILHVLEENGWETGSSVMIMPSSY